MTRRRKLADISTIIPAYNAASTLGETLDSVSRQTCAATVEVIVVDDGSQDDTAAIASAHELAPTVIRTGNRGAPSAINAGVRASTGNYICVLDADDMWSPEKLDLQLDLLASRREIDVVFGHVDTFECPSIPEEEFARLTYQKGRMPGYLFGTSMVRHDILVQKIGPLDEGLRRGYWVDWYRRLVDAGAQVEMIDRVFLQRRIRPGTLSQRKSGQADKGMSSDFLEVARRALLAKRKPAG